MPERLAPAKVNLFLHVGPLGADGYHPVCSLMTFADVGDLLRLERRPETAFAVEGEFAAGLGGDANLVVTAREALLAVLGQELPPFTLTLEKRLPVAAGLGGGSSDAAAALRLIVDAFGLRRDASADTLARIARGLGADVTACLVGQAVLARGRGDECDDPPKFPDIDAVLVNPMVPSSTRAIYAAFDAAGAGTEADDPVWPAAIDTVEQLADFLAACRNDLEAPAIALQPAIAEVLAALRARPQTLFARMSGSGATCFALCADAQASEALRRAVAEAHPAWWVRRCRLEGFRP
ncbi:MAG TPA: 4-(cytidine 5'-diphospho)-2-C-methyl-D-erythritol kinase [Caulobacteraceae bacterium]|jgi:4-diphosphocytidyl-2-C-methyl-D-erythritol kinase